MSVSPMEERSIFEGLPLDELAGELERLERRRFEPGTTVVAEGDRIEEVFLIQSGAADVLVSDQTGVETRIASLIPGSAIGEMSLITGEPVAATVRAASDLEVLVIGADDFTRLADQYPRIYRNIGALLADRLDRSNRRALDATAITVLRDLGAPPLLGYALACSVAWHLRQRTLLLVLDDSPARELSELARATPRRRLRGRRRSNDTAEREPRADLMLVTSAIGFAADTLAARAEDLYASYGHVLVQVRAGTAMPPAGRVVDLAGPESGVSAGEGSSGLLCGWVEGAAAPETSGDWPIRVPPFDSDDTASLHAGSLPPTTEAGRAMGCAARDIASLKVGLALGGGGAKGYAHCGVLAALERAGVPIDYLAGTSIGGAVAGMYAVGLTPPEIAAAFDRIASGTFRFAIPPISSLLSSRRIRAFTRDIFGDAHFEELRMPVAMNAVDIATRTEVVFTRGLVWPAVMSTMAIPGVYPPQRIGPYVLVDGGVVNPVPTDIAAQQGADIVIAVNLGRVPTPSVLIDSAESRSGGGLMLSLILRSFELMQSRISASTLAPATIAISPALGAVPVRLRDFGAGRALIEAGEAAAEEALPRIASVLPWLRASSDVHAGVRVPA